MGNLRKRLEQKRLLLAPGVYDGLTARLVEQAGFEAVYMTGAGVSASCGFPDYGLVSATEMTSAAETVVRSTSLPVIADADTGYGNELNVTRTVRDFEMRGVSAIHIEDQVLPKRCGHLDGKQVIRKEEYVSKIAAAVAARRNADFLIIARTDARAVNGFEDAISRANSAVDAGADMVFVEAVQSLQEMAAVPERVRVPCVLNVVPGGKTPAVSQEDAERMGYRMAILPGATLQTIVPALDRALARLKSEGLRQSSDNSSADIREAFRRFGAGEWDALRQEYAT